MLKAILVGLDGTRDSDGALAYGVKLAQKFDSLVVGCGVVDEPSIRAGDATLFAEGYFGPSDVSLLADARRQALATLEHFTKYCEAAGVRSRSALDMGTPHVQILAEAHRYDLVVLGSHTHFELGWRTADDATLQHVLQECARPIIVVPAATPHDLEGPIVIAFDGSVRSSRALYDLVASSIAKNRPVHVMTIDRDPEVAARVSRRAIDFLSFHDHEAYQHPFDGAFPAAEAVLGAVESLEATLLVIGAYGHTPLRELLLGSTTRSVMARSPVPVFCSH